MTEQISTTAQDRGRLLDATALVAYPSDLAARRLRCCWCSDLAGARRASATATAGARRRAGVGGLRGGGARHIGLRAFGRADGLPRTSSAPPPRWRRSTQCARAYGTSSLNGPACARQPLRHRRRLAGGHAALWVDRIDSYYAPTRARGRRRDGAARGHGSGDQPRAADDSAGDRERGGVLHGDRAVVRARQGGCRRCSARRGTSTCRCGWRRAARPTRAQADARAIFT